MGIEYNNINRSNAAEINTSYESPTPINKEVANIANSSGFSTDNLSKKAPKLPSNTQRLAGRFVGGLVAPSKEITLANLPTLDLAAGAMKLIGDIGNVNNMKPIEEVELPASVLIENMPKADQAVALGQLFIDLGLR